MFWCSGVLAFWCSKAAWHRLSMYSIVRAETCCHLHTRNRRRADKNVAVVVIAVVPVRTGKCCIGVYDSLLGLCFYSHTSSKEGSRDVLNSQPPSQTQPDINYNIQPWPGYHREVQLWNTNKSCNTDQVRRLVAGRLCGAAIQIAMRLRIQRSDGSALIGSQAVAAPSIPSSTHPGDKSGGKRFLERLVEEYGIHDQEQATIAPDQFFNHTGEGHDLLSYLAIWRLYREEAIELGGLQLNNAAKSYLQLRCSGLPKQKQDDIKFEVSGALHDFNEIWAILHRMRNQKRQRKQIPHHH